jgi:hypothetical protein
VLGGLVQQRFTLAHLETVAGTGSGTQVMVTMQQCAGQFATVIGCQVGRVVVGRADLPVEQ